MTTVATESAQDAAQGVVDTVTATATDVVQDVETTAQSVVEDTAVALTTDEPAVSDPLSVAGFDLTKVSDMIDASSVNDMSKMALKAGLQQAKDNPDQLKAILDQIKAALQK